MEGASDRFNVTWAPARRVNLNNTRVYYDVSLNFFGQHSIEVSDLETAFTIMITSGG